MKTFTSYFSLITYFIIHQSCANDIRRDAFEGLTLGSSYQEYNTNLKSKGHFNDYKGRNYYQFTTQNGKHFYGAFYATLNKDSLVTNIDVFITQFVQQISDLGNAEMNYNSIELNLTEDDKTLASEDEIFEYIKANLDTKYKIISTDSGIYSVPLGLNVISKFYRGKDITIDLSRITSSIPKSLDWEPVGRIRISYSYSIDFIHKNSLLQDSPSAKKKGEF